MVMVLGRARTSSAEIARRTYEKGLKATQEYFDTNPIHYDRVLRQFNYTAPWLALL